MNRNVNEKDIQVTNKHVKRWSTSFATREIQIKSNHNEMSLHTHQNGYNEKAATTSNVGEDAENKASLNITGGNVKLCSHSRKHSDSVTG